MTAELRTAKRPVNRAAGPYGHPMHPILVTVPIGAWISSLVFDIGSHVVDRPGFLAQGAEWLIAIGVVGAVLAALAGTLDLVAIPTGTRAFRTGLVHMALNLAIAAGFVVDFFWRHASYGTPTAVGTGQLVLSVVLLCGLGVSGFLGGTLAYRFGVRVAAEPDQADAFRHTPARTSGGGRARTAH